MKNICFILIYFLSTLNIKAQNVDFEAFFNNSNDKDNYSQMIEEIKSHLNKSEISEAINNLNKSGIPNAPECNYQGIKFQAIFYDRGYIGNLKLKAENQMTPENYVLHWKDNNQEKHNIAFLFVKGYNNEKYKFQSIIVSKILEGTHLFPIIIDYINSNLVGDDYTMIIKNGIKYITRALNPIWTKEKMDQAGLLFENQKYYANKINAQINFSYLDFMPSAKGSFDENSYKLVGCAKGKTEIAPKEYIYKEYFVSEKYIYIDPIQSKSKIPKFYEYPISFGISESTEALILENDDLYDIITEIESSKKHNPSKHASDYNWSYNKDENPSRKIVDFNGFRDRNESDRLIMYVNEEYKDHEGEDINILSGAYKKTTWCNVFARDLSIKLFNHVPWGEPHACANQLHYRISNDKQNFQEVSLEEAWKYTMAGYVVYLTSFYYKMSNDLLDLEKESKVPEKPSGHISTCYPIQGINKDFSDYFLIQAGRTTDITQKSNCFGKDYKNIKAHIYLGYIVK